MSNLRQRVSVASALVHGTCVAAGTQAALLRGPSGAGKSDLALRFVTLPAEAGFRPALVADDQVQLARGDDGVLFASPPATLAGKIEVRGIGIVEVPFVQSAQLALVCDLVGIADVPRMPPEQWEQSKIAGVLVPVIKLDPFELSAALKLKLALLRACNLRPN